jgi:hypothetical protein
MNANSPFSSGTSCGRRAAHANSCVSVSSPRYIASRRCAELSFHSAASSRLQSARSAASAAVIASGMCIEVVIAVILGSG